MPVGEGTAAVEYGPDRRREDRKHDDKSRQEDARHGGTQDQPGRPVSR